METFYRFLGGPRTFWGGSNKVIINNFGFRPMGRPIFVHHHCGGGFNRLFGFMAGMNLLSNIFGSFSQPSMPYMYNNYNGFGAYGQYNQYGMYGGYSNNDSLNSRLKVIEKEVQSLEKQVEDMKKQGCDCDNKTTGAEKPEKTETENKVENAKETSEAEKVEEAKPVDKTEKTEPVEESVDNKPKTLDELLNNMEEFKKLDSSSQDYVKKRIESAYTDENGNIKYNIKATVHDGDTMTAIINRFYTEQEQQELNVAQNEYNTQVSGKKVKNPNSGDTINANGISEYGLKSLIEDAKQGITRDGEIQKTNKKMNELKEAFINGEKKLSKEYVLQNHFMSEAEYNKIIQNKYSE